MSQPATEVLLAGGVVHLAQDGITAFVQVNSVLPIWEVFAYNSLFLRPSRSVEPPTPHELMYWEV